MFEGPAIALLWRVTTAGPVFAIVPHLKGLPPLGPQLRYMRVDGRLRAGENKDPRVSRLRQAAYRLRAGDGRVQRQLALIRVQ